MTVPDPSAHAADVARIEALLATERDALLARFRAVPESGRAVPPPAGGWSAVEVVQHVARVEAGVVKMLGAGASMPRVTADEAAAAQWGDRKSRIVRDRSEKVQAPERTHPRGGVDAASVIAEVTQSRAALLAAFRAADPAVLDGVTYPHPFIGPLTLRAWVELIAHHDARHAEQLAELAPTTGG